MDQIPRVARDDREGLPTLAVAFGRGRRRCGWSDVCGLQQFTRMSATNIALRIAAKHARDLSHARIAARDDDVRRRHSATRALAHDDVMVRARRNLR